jgi:integrase
MPLTDSQIRQAKPCEKPIEKDKSGKQIYETVDGPYKLTDGGGLYLEVRPTGAKLWRYRYRIAGKENVFAIGEYAQAPSGETEEQTQSRCNAGMLTLAEARARRKECRALVKEGIHPAHHRQAARMEQYARNANTFQGVALEWIDKKKSNWTPYYLRQVERFLAADVYPHIGKLPIRKIAAPQLLAILRRVEERGAETVALLIRQWTSAVFRHAISTLRADIDPTIALRGAIHRPKVVHRTELSRDQIADFVKELEAYKGHKTTVIALRLLLLTFVRPVELRAASWREIDFDRAEWRIPGERMKLRELHIVPLSQQAMKWLRELHTLTGGRELLFPNIRNPLTCMTGTTMNRALESMGFNGKGSIGFSAHGFRATASTILNEIGFRHDAIERQLAHAERNKSRGAYNRATYLEERRGMMQQWADMIDEMSKTESNVVAIKRAAA